MITFYAKWCNFCSCFASGRGCVYCTVTWFIYLSTERRNSRCLKLTLFVHHLFFIPWHKTITLSMVNNVMCAYVYSYWTSSIVSELTTGMWRSFKYLSKVFNILYFHWGRCYLVGYWLLLSISLKPRLLKQLLSLIFQKFIQRPHKNHLFKIHHVFWSVEFQREGHALNLDTHVSVKTVMFCTGG